MIHLLLRKAMRSLKLFLLFVLTLGVAGRSSDLMAQDQSKAIPVFVTEVQKEQISDRIEALGTLRANESVVLTATVAETVSNIHFDDGKFVKQDEVLVEMTSQEEHALLNEARSRVAEAELQYNRVEPLARQGAAPVSLVDERKREYETAQAQLQAIESRLGDRIIKAPFEGVLGLRRVSVGALVTPGDEVVTLDDITVMKLDFSVPSTFLSELEAGLAIQAKAKAFPDLVFEGSVSSIDSRIDPTTRSIVVRALIPNPDRKLRPGLLMVVELFRNPRSSVVIPEESIVSQGTQKFVFVVKDQDQQKILERREVVSGARFEGKLEILRGLEEGEKIVTHGVIRAREGIPVDVQAEQVANESLQETLSKGG